MDINCQGNQQSLHPSVHRQQTMEVPGNPGMGHMTLQHNHVNDNDLAGGGKVMDQSAYYAMTGHHGNIYHGNPQHQPSQGMKGFSGNMEGSRYGQMMGSPPGLHGNAGGGMPHNMAMYKSQAMMGHGSGGSRGMGMGRGYRGQGMNQYHGNMMQHGLQHNVGSMPANRGAMMQGGGHIQQRMHMMGNGGQSGMVTVHGHYVGQQYVDMSQGQAHHQPHHPQHHHQQHSQQHSQQQQQQQQQHHQYLGSPPNPCLMSPPPPQPQSHQQQMPHTSPTMAQHGYSPSMKSYHANMAMEATSQLQQPHQLHPHAQQQQPQQSQQQQQQQHRVQQPHYQQQQQQQQQSMATVNLNQMNHAMPSSAKQLPDFRTLAAASAAGGAGAASATMPAGMPYGYHKSGMRMNCDDGVDSTGTGSNPSSSMCMEVGSEKGVDTVTVGPNPHSMSQGYHDSFSQGVSGNMKKQVYGNSVNRIHANHALSPGSCPQNHQMLHHLRTMQSSGVTLNVTSSRVVTQTASAMSPAVTTTHVAPVVSHSALQNPVLTSHLKSGPAVHNAPEINPSLCPPSRNPHQSLPSPAMQSPPLRMSTSSVAVAKHLCSPTSAISSPGCRQQQQQQQQHHPTQSSTIPSSLAMTSVSSLASSAPAISALLSGTRGPSIYDGTSKTMPCPRSSPSCHTDAHHHHSHTHKHEKAPSCSEQLDRLSQPSPGGFDQNKQGISTTSTSVVTITVPFGWRRVVEAGAVAYYSPNGVRLTSLSHVTKYLQSDGTCKCGLECPLLVEKVFNFDPQVASKQWNSNEISVNDDLTKLCNHKRKIIAMATFHKTALQRDRGIAASLLTDSSGEAANTDDPKSQPSDVSGTRNMKDHPYDRMLASRLFSHREQSRGCANEGGLLSKGHASQMDKESSDNSLVPKQEPGHEAVYPHNLQSHNALHEKTDLSQSIKEEKCERPEDDSGDCLGEKRLVDKKPDLKTMAQKVQAALRNPERGGGCAFAASWNKQRPRAQSDGCYNTGQSEHELPSHLQRSLSDSYQNHRIHDKQANANLLSSPVMQKMADHALIAKSHPEGFNNQRGRHGRYMPMDVDMALSAKTDHTQGAGFHNMKHPMLGRQNFPPDMGVPDGSGPVDINLQLPGLPTMESWAEMQKVGRKKPMLKRNKRKLNHILDRTSPCPNVDVRHIQQEQKPGQLSSVPSFFENPSTFLAHQSALVANSLGKTEIQTEGLGEQTGSIHSQMSPSPSISSMSTKSATPTGKLTPLSSPGRPCSQTSPACSSTSSTPKNMASSLPYQVGSSKPGSLHHSPRQLQQLDLQKQLNLVAGGSSSFQRMMDPVAATLAAGKEKVQKEEGHSSPQITSLNLHTVLNPRSSTSFPASSLLSAAARAQGGKHQASPAERAKSPPEHSPQQQAPGQHPHFREFGLSSQSQETMQHSIAAEPEPPYHVQQPHHNQPPNHHHHHQHQHHQPHHHHHPHQHQQHQQHQQHSQQQMAMMNNVPGSVPMSFMVGVQNNTPAMYGQVSPGGPTAGSNPPGPVMMPASGQPAHANMPPMNPGYMNMNQGLHHSRQVQSMREAHQRHLKEQTPIEKVQDMISGLEAAQNAIVAAHAAATAQEAMGKHPDGTWPAKRRKSSTSSDGSVLSRQSTSRCSNGGAATDMSITPGIEKGLPENYRGGGLPVHPQAGEGMMPGGMYGNMPLSQSVDGTMDPNGPAAGAVINPNALAGTPQGLNNTGIPMVNMNIAGAMPSINVNQMTAGTSAVSPIIPAVPLSQLNNPQLMHILGGTNSLQNSMLVSNPVNMESVQGSTQSPEKGEQPQKVRTNPVEAAVEGVLKEQLEKAKGITEGLPQQHIEQDQNPKTQPNPNNADNVRTSPNSSGSPDKQNQESGPQHTQALKSERESSANNMTKANLAKYTGSNALQIQTDHSSTSALPTGIQVSPRAAWTSPDSRVKRKRERSRKSSTPTIANMLQAAQNPQAQNPVVMLPSMQTPLLQVVNPALSQIIGQMPEGAMNQQQQQLMYLSLAMQNPHLNAQMLQGQDLSALSMAAASQGQLNFPQGQTGLNLTQGQQLSPIQGQADMNLLQNQLSMLQALNMMPSLTAGVNPALLQSLQAMQNAGLVGLQNMATLQPQMQQQMLRQFAPLLVQNQQLLQQLMQQGVANPGSDLMAQMLAEQRQQQQTPEEEESQQVGVEKSQSETSVEPDEGFNMSRNGTGDSKAAGGQSDCGETLRLSASTPSTRSESEDSAKKVSPDAGRPASRLPPIPTISPSHRQMNTSSSDLEDKPSSPADTPIPNPANLTEAVTAVVQSQDVFGDDEDDDGPHIEPPVRKYTVKKPRNHIRRISNCKATNRNMVLDPPLSPPEKSPVVRTLQFEASAQQNTDSNGEDVNMLPEEPSEAEEIPDQHVSMNSIGTNTDEDGCLENTAEDLDANCQSEDGVLIGTNMASTATMTDEEQLNELDQMTDDDDMDMNVGNESDHISDMASNAEEPVSEYNPGEEDTCPSEVGLEQTDENTDEENTIEDTDDRGPFDYTEDDSLVDQEGEAEPQDEESNLPDDDADDRSSQVTETDTVENHMLQDGMSDGGSEVPDEELPTDKASLPEAMEQLSQDDGEDRDIDNNELEDESADSGDELPKLIYPRTFNIGDVVWGQTRGYPSWPGKLVDETAVKGNHHKTELGKLWVRWFGDHSFTQVQPEELKTLSEGLEAHHHARKKYRRGRKMNVSLEAAIQEAMLELDRQAASTASTPKADKVSAPSVAPTPTPAPAVPTLPTDTTAGLVKTNKARPPKKRKR